jgi:hypothetical protein
MTYDNARDLDQQVLGTFVRSYLKRYQRWKRQDLLVVALETMPKQVKTERILGNLLKLQADFEKRLSDEG